MRPFAIIDWGCDFPAGLAGMLLETGDLARTLVVFPHQRPRRYLLEALHARAGGRPLLLPEIATIGELTPRLRQRIEGRPLRQAPELDRAGLLAEAVAELGPAAGPLANLPPERFFPWGLRLAGLLEELFSHNLAPADLAGLEGSVEDTAAAILARLARLAAAYARKLEALGWTTPGRDAAWVAQHAGEACELLAGRRVALAGFHALTGSEDALLRELWRCGARVVLHTDAGLARGRAAAHWSCAEHADWLEAWGARAEVACPAPEGRERSVRFHEGFDLHSQLAQLPELLAQTSGPTAVVLPDTGLLMPVLHHLPDKAVNVSMGYPLARSNLARLVECLCALQENARPAGSGGGYHWRDLVALLRHPYLRLLPAGGGQTLRSALRLLEEKVRSGQAYADPRTLDLAEADLPGAADLAAVRAALDQVWAACLDCFAAAATLADLGQALLGLVRLLVPEEATDPEPEGHGPWRRFPVDAECLYRLAQDAVPALCESRASRTALDRDTLYAVLRELLARQRVAFEAEPLTGVQVLGMLETRLLAFDRVLVLEAVEDKLPGPPAPDPLLPDPLRRDLGLPDSRQRSRVAAHTFHALLAGCNEAHLLTQRGAVSRGPLPGKSVRSRFVEELLWEEEQRRGALVAPGDPIYRVAELRVTAPDQPAAGLAKTPAIREKLARMLATQAFSASRLDAYLACPLQFFHHCLTPLREAPAVDEEGDPAGLGILVHDLLRDVLRPRLHQAIGPDSLDPSGLAEDFAARLRASEFFSRMPWRRRAALERVGRERLARFAGNVPAGRLLALEEPCSAHLDTGLGPRLLVGRLDRVDERADGPWVLDYKTGAPRKPRAGFWKDEALWARMEAWKPGEDPDLLAAVADAVQSVQLPLYLHLWFREKGVVPANAAMVELRASGAEVPLFGDKVTAGEREHVAVDLAPRLAAFLLRHLAGSETFAARTGPHCAWCPYGYGCPLPEQKRR